MMRLWAGWYAAALALVTARGAPRPLLATLDCKGGPDARVKAERTRRLLHGVGARRVAIWPDEARLSLWVLPPRDLSVLLFQMIETGDSKPPPSAANSPRSTPPALITELETPADPSDPAAQALRQRIRARFTELYGQRTTLDQELAALEEPPTEQASDPSLLDELPFLGDILTSAPAGLTERLLDAFDVQVVYNRDKHQVTIHATLTDATPQAIKDLLTDPRATTTPRYHHNQGPHPKIMLAI